MNIGIDAHVLGRGRGGNATYTSHLIRGLLEIDRRNRYDIFVTGEVSRADVGTFSGNQNFFFSRLPKNRWARFGWAVAHAASRAKTDVLHVQYVIPPGCKAKFVLTVHDISFVSFPEFFSKKELLYLGWVKRAVRQADRVIAGSGFTKEELVKKMDADPAKIDVIYNGVGSLFGPMEDKNLVMRTLAKYGVAGDFILCVGRLHIRKNLWGLIRAYAILKKTMSPPPSLVFVGPPGGQEKRLATAVQEMGLGKDVVMAGVVPEEDLSCFYNGARLCVYPSFYEGFGFPVVEAMACGVPVITSGTTCLPEIAGDAACFVDPYSVEDLAQAMKTHLCDDRRRQGLVEAGLARSRRFSWQKAAALTVESYAAAYGGKA